MNINKNIYESPLVGLLLSMNSGAIDAYTFLQHGQVFVGLQTGNFILLGMSLSKLAGFKSLRYLFSILMFALGVVFIKHLQASRYKERNIKRIILIIDVILLIIVGILANILSDIFIVGLLAIAAAAQFQEFKLMNGNPFNPLMMTGNLRKLLDNFYSFLRFKNVKSRRIAIDTCLVLFCFILGSLIMGLLTNVFDKYAIFLNVLIIFSVLLITNKN